MTIEIIPLLFNLAMFMVFAVRLDLPKLLYWGGASILTLGVMLMGVKQ